MGKKTNITTPLFGAIAGDVIGSAFEWNNVLTTKFDLFCERSAFTDDTVLSIAVADSILNGKDYGKTLYEYGRKFSDKDYGVSFHKWLKNDERKPYRSYGNGSAMRVSACGCFYDTLEETLAEAKKSAMPTHNHQEGIKGAQATAAAIYLARNGAGKNKIKKYIQDTFNYNLKRKLDVIREIYIYNESCQGTVPEAVTAFLESTDFENAIRLAVSIGGDSDTIACITGGIALGFYKKMPEEIEKRVWEMLPKEFQEVVLMMNEKQ